MHGIRIGPHVPHGGIFLSLQSCEVSFEVVVIDVDTVEPEMIISIVSD